jgi:nitrogen fixation protein NifU and related proteins
MIYSEKVMDHFKNPRNVGEIPDADGIGEVGNPVCGDMMTFYIKVKDNRLADIKFKTFGCGAAIAVSSIVSELAMGKTLEEALKINREDVAKELGGLPPNKMHCSNLGADALHKAIENYKNKKAKTPASIETSEQKTTPDEECTCPFCNQEAHDSPNNTCIPCDKQFIPCPNCGNLSDQKASRCDKCGMELDQSGK